MQYAQAHVGLLTFPIFSDSSRNQDDEGRGALSYFPPHRRFRTSVITHRSEWLGRLLRGKLQVRFSPSLAAVTCEVVKAQASPVSLCGCVAANPDGHDHGHQPDQPGPRTSRIHIDQNSLQEKHVRTYWPVHIGDFGPP